MKKVLFTAVAALAMTAMVACNNNKAAEATEDTTAATTEQCEKKCNHECGDTAACCQAKVEGAACEGEAKECCKKAEGQKCCKGESQECNKEAAK